MANNALIGAVRGEATLESGKFVSGARKIRQEAKATETQLKKSFGAMGAAAKGFGGALAAGLSVGLLAGAAKKALDYAGSLGEVAQQLGVTTKQLQVYRYAAGQVGVSQEKLEAGLSKLNVTLGAAKLGNKAAVETFAQLSKIIGKDIVDASKQGGDALPLIADAMSKITDRAVRAKLEVLLFGKAGAALDNLLSGGSKAINELSLAAEKLGIVLSDEQIQKADETADKLEAVKTVLAAQIAGTVAENATSILALANALASLTSSIVKFLGSNPQAALAILGGLAGSRFGIVGAAGGALAGFTAGENVAANARDSNTDLKFRAQELRKARERFSNARRLSSKTAPDAQLIASEKELRKQIDLTNKARAASRRSTSTGGTTSVPEFLGGGGSKSGRTPRAPRDRSDDVSFQFDQELRRAQIDVLRAQQGLARTSDERAAIALKLLAADRRMQEAELNDRVRRAERDYAEGKITAGTLEQVKAQADALRAQYDEADALQRKAIADDLAADKARDAAELVQSAYDLRLEQLQNEAALKETAAERREVELRILALMKEQELARLNAVLADKDASELAKAQAQQRKDELDGIYAGRADVVKQGTRGPMEDYLAGLPTTAAKAQQALEQLQVQGFEGLIDAAVALTDGFDSAKDALLSTLKQFLQGLIRMQLQQGLGSILGSGGMSFFGSLFGGGSSALAGFSGTASSNVAALNAIPMNVPGFASGGSMMLRGIPGLDKNIISMNGVPIARANYGERLSFQPANDRGRGGGLTQNFKVYAKDADSFHRSEGQILRTARRRLGV